MAIVLASTSPYRRELMHRLRLPFEVLAPAVDEARLPAEAPLALALRIHNLALGFSGIRIETLEQAMALWNAQTTPRQVMETIL